MNPEKIAENLITNYFEGKYESHVFKKPNGDHLVLNITVLANSVMFEYNSAFYHYAFDNLEEGQLIRNCDVAIQL